ncbi:MAG: TonB-dependent receptor [Desulfosarcina sp.]|nr:TonB-dependent receptor [Desulfosarcina sp.]
MTTYSPGSCAILQARTRTKATDPDPLFGYVYEEITDREGAQAQISAGLDRVALTGGVDWVNDEIETSSAPARATYDNPAGFLLAKGKLLGERLTLSAGGRHDSYEVEIKEGEGGKEEDDHFTPNVGLAYLVTDQLKVRANYGQAFVVPGADQLAADYPNPFSFTGARVLGNPDLKPEKSATWEGGLDFTGKGLFASLTLTKTLLSSDRWGKLTLKGDITNLFNSDYEYVKEAQIVESAVNDYIHKTLMIDLTKPMAVASTLEGFREKIRHVGNSYSPSQVWGLYHRIGLDASRQQFMDSLGRDRVDTSLLFTGADMDNLSVERRQYKAMSV